MQELEMANGLLGAAEARVLRAEIDTLNDEIAARAEVVADQVLGDVLAE
ncbi:hypothetical protein ACIO6T_30820 [Streptomyces sp. NPDC087532]